MALLNSYDGPKLKLPTVQSVGSDTTEKQGNKYTGPKSYKEKLIKDLEIAKSKRELNSSVETISRNINTYKDEIPVDKVTKTPMIEDDIDYQVHKVGARLDENEKALRVFKPMILDKNNKSTGIVKENQSGWFYFDKSTNPLLHGNAIHENQINEILLSSNRYKVPVSSLIATSIQENAGATPDWFDTEHKKIDVSTNRANNTMWMNDELKAKGLGETGHLWRAYGYGTTAMDDFRMKKHSTIPSAFIKKSEYGWPEFDNSIARKQDQYYIDSIRPKLKGTLDEVYLPSDANAVQLKKKGFSLWNPGDKQDAISKQKIKDELDKDPRITKYQKLVDNMSLSQRDSIMSLLKKKGARFDDFIID